MANKYKLKFTLSDGNTIDAGEIVVPEGAKGDKGDKGDPYTLTATDKAAIVQDVLAALPYYDGSANISGGETLISFTIDDEPYQAVEGMTWAEWVESGYNTDGWINTGTYLEHHGSLVVTLVVNLAETIIPNKNYSATHGGGSKD